MGELANFNPNQTPAFARKGELSALAKSLKKEEASLTSLLDDFNARYERAMQTNHEREARGQETLDPGVIDPSLRDLKKQEKAMRIDKLKIFDMMNLCYFVFYIWTWVTTEIKPVIGQANGTLIALIDRIRMLDNDLIRLNQKVETVMALRGKTIEKERMLAESDINIDPLKKRREEEERRRHDAAQPAAPHKATLQEIKDAAGDD